MAFRQDQRIRWAVLPRVPFTCFEPYILTGRGGGGANRIDDRIPQDVVAKSLGCSRRTINRYVQDGVPLDQVEPLCRFLGKHPIEVLGRGHPALILLVQGILDDPVLQNDAEEFFGSGHT